MVPKSNNELYCRGSINGGGFKAHQGQGPHIRKRKESLSPRDILVGHQRVYSSKKITNQIQKHNFKILKKSGFLLKILSNKQLLKLDKNLINGLYKISNDLPAELMADLGFIIKKN